MRGLVRPASSWPPRRRPRLRPSRTTLPPRGHTGASTSWDLSVSRAGLPVDFGRHVEAQPSRLAAVSLPRLAEWRSAASRAQRTALTATTAWRASDPGLASRIPNSSHPAINFRRSLACPRLVIPRVICSASGPPALARRVNSLGLHVLASRRRCRRRIARRTLL